MSPRPAALAALAAALAALGVCGCGGSSSSTSADHPPATLTAASTLTVPRTTNTAPAPRPATTSAAPVSRPARPKPNPGSLPQTDQRPSASTPAFHAEMNALWDGVTRNSITAALPAFFPEGAYLQLKQIADAGGDYTGRLLVDYGLDLGAAHALLGPDPGSAQLVGLQVPESYAHWVDPGVCYNAVGYYEVPNARVVYRQSGQVHSFGIASMISWRGTWYVVHLGAILRSSPGGVVDDPSTGVGTSVPSSTC